jgi:hypothetical protein
MPNVVIRTSREVHLDQHGNPFRGIDMIVDDETINEWRAGYRCAAHPVGCGAAQREAFPEKCIEPYCNFNLKRDLARWLEIAFAGEENLWPTRAADDLGIWTPDS